MYRSLFSYNEIDMVNMTATAFFYLSRVYFYKMAISIVVDLVKEGRQNDI